MVFDRRRAGPSWLIAAMVMVAPLPASARDGRAATPGGSPLIQYFEILVREQDQERFRVEVLARYTDRELCRLAHAPSAEVRRAAVAALGATGGFDVGRALASALKDPDPLVRGLAAEAMWSVWFRADLPENNARLREVADLIGRGRHREAEQLAGRLIERAPRFAEAYNQRAIVRFAEGRFAESADDCRKVLELNPYHFGALSGLGQCYLRLGRPEEARATFRRALDLQPYSDGLRRTVEALERMR
jgi:tetratricopeptide (TPR) repeat protein